MVNQNSDNDPLSQTQAHQKFESARFAYTKVFRSPGLLALASVTSLFLAAYVRRPYDYRSISNLHSALGHSLRGRVIYVNGLEIKVLHTPRFARFFRHSRTQLKLTPVGVDFIQQKGLELIWKQFKPKQTVFFRPISVQNGKMLESCIKYKKFLRSKDLSEVLIEGGYAQFVGCQDEKVNAKLQAKEEIAIKKHKGQWKSSWLDWILRR